MKKFLSLMLALTMLLCAAFALTVTTNANGTAALIGETPFDTLEAAFAAAENGDTVVLQADLKVDTKTITIADGTTVTLDMNGHKITVTDNATKNYEFFYIYGGLTVTGNGVIELTSTNDRDWDAMSAIFHNRGGVLTIENGRFENLGGTDMAWVIDNSGNYYGDATTNIQGGTLISTYTAIRNRMEQNTHGASGTAILNVSGGTIDGATSAIWAQAASSNAVSPATGKINVTGGDIGVINTARSSGAVCNTTISGGNVEKVKAEEGELKISGGYVGELDILTAGGAEAAADDIITGGTFGSDVKNYVSDSLVLSQKADGSYGVAEVGYVAQIGDNKYETLEAAIKAVPKNVATTITMLQSYKTTGPMVGHQYVQNITIDLNGYILSNNGIVLTSYRSGTVLTVTNGTISGNNSSGSLRATYGGKIVLGDNVTINGVGGSATLIYVDNGSLDITAKDGVAFTGGKLDIKTSANVNNKLNVAASIGRTYFGTLADAIAAAENEDEIVLQSNVSVDVDDVQKLNGKYDSFFVISGKEIAINLNGKNITGDATGISMLVGIFSTEDNGHLTINGEGNVTVNNTVDNMANALVINYDDSSSIVINGGNYYLDYSNNALIDTRSNEGVKVNGGTFKLGNLGTLANGSPWIFNAKGQNTAHVEVYGGSFQADVAHQYYPFEVQIPRELALSKGADGMYTVVPAVAWVNEQEWSSNWYTNEIGYATLEEAFAAVSAEVKIKVTGGKTYVAKQEYVTILNAQPEDVKDILANTQAGDVVAIPEGTYTSFPTSSLKEGVTIVCPEGTVFEGNSKLNINGATVIGATFSNPTGTAADQTINGVFKDCVFEGKNGLRWCYAGDTVVFENCIFSGDVYGVHFDGGANEIIFKNCTFSGFNAIGGEVALAKYEGCTFVANGKSGYNGINMWGNTQMTDCTFVFDGSASYEWVDAVGDNKTYTFNGCVINDGTTERPLAASDVGNFGTGNTIAVN